MVSGLVPSGGGPSPGDCSVLLGDDILDVGRLDGDGPFRPLHGEHHLVAPTADLRNLAGYAAVGFDLLAFLKDPELLPVLVGELHFLAALVNDALDLGNGDALHVAIGVNDLDGLLAVGGSFFFEGEVRCGFFLDGDDAPIRKSNLGARAYRLWRNSARLISSSSGLGGCPWL